jgi:plasmid stabilization system protein ParE
MYKVNIIETAEFDLKEASNYIALTLDNKIAAGRLLDSAGKVALSLSENPERQPLVRDDFLASKGLRSIPVGNYFLFYVIRKKINQVNVLRCIHSRRDWANLFSNISFE